MIMTAMMMMVVASMSPWTSFSAAYFRVKEYTMAGTVFR